LDGFTKADMIVMRLYRLRHHCQDNVFPIEMTHLGVSRMLGIGKTHALNELKKLAQEGLVEIKKKSRVAEGKRKMNVYIPTPAGRKLAESLSKTYGVDLGARPVNGDRPQHSWLLELDTLASEHRPNAPTGPPKLPRDEPENRPDAPRS